MSTLSLLSLYVLFIQKSTVPVKEMSFRDNLSKGDCQTKNVKNGTGERVLKIW